MSIENWIQISVPVVGVIIAVVSASLSYFFTKRNQLRIDEARLKEQHYLRYIKALSNNVMSDIPLDESRSELSDAHNHILLIGSSDVVIQLRRFTEYIAVNNKSNFTSDCHDKMLTELIKSMRRDLYKGRSVNRNYPIISLSGSRGRKKSKETL